MRAFSQISEPAVRPPSLIVALLALVCFASPAYAECPEGNVEVVVETPSGKVHVLCLPPETVEIIENSPAGEFFPTGITTAAGFNALQCGRDRELALHAARQVLTHRKELANQRLTREPGDSGSVITSTNAVPSGQ